jgi:hypothetical protein
MKSSRRQISLSHGKSSIQFHLWRLSDVEYSHFREASIPIRIDSKFLTLMYLFKRDDSEEPILPMALVSLEKIFGLSSDYFDSYKQTFRFPLLMSLERTSGRFFYLLEVCDYKGMVEYNFYRLLDSENDGNNTDYHEPFELEFSDEEIKLFIGYFEGYLIGRSQSDRHNLQPFWKNIDSSHILYGYKNEEFFMQEYKSDEEYEAAKQSVLDDFGSNITINKAARSKELKVARNKELLERILAE